MARILYGIKTLAEALTHNVLGMASGLFGFPVGGSPAFGLEIRNRFSGLTDRVFLAISRYIIMAQNAARLFTETNSPAVADIPRNPNLPVGTAYQATLEIATPNLTPSGPDDTIRWLTVTVPFSRRPSNLTDVNRALAQTLAQIGQEEGKQYFPDISQVIGEFTRVTAIERRGRS